MNVIGIEAAQQLLQDPQRPVEVLDVRRPDEFEAGHLRDAIQVNVLEDDFADRASALDRTTEYLVYCAKGGRSARAVEQMESMGFQNLHDLEGGFTAWVDAGMPVDDADRT